ncbi:ATP-binding protein [Actinoallomurus sp. NPDC052274]|uniref:ATP-binding protein n=1 Tax=Actinoallomurus sp. NPDC052274 TaxID=3155420 RepID=UPI003414D1F2
MRPPWTRCLPGLPASVTEARRFVTAYLRDLHPEITMRAELVVSELATNAIKHTLSGLPGGMLWVTVTIFDTAVRVSVTDQGGVTAPTAVVAGDCSEGGRGLALLGMVVKDWGHHYQGSHCTVWAVVDGVDRA